MNTFWKVIKIIGASLLAILATACVVFNVLVWTEVIEVNTSQSFIGLINTCLIFGAYMIFGINMFTKNVESIKASRKAKKSKKQVIIIDGKIVKNVDLNYSTETIKVFFEDGSVKYMLKKDYNKIAK